jgi:hypothetical protein
MQITHRITELTDDQCTARDSIYATRMRGEAALGLNNLSLAEECLHDALRRARNLDHVSEELEALVALGSLRHRQARSEEARKYLGDVWETTEKGPYRLIGADAHNVLAQIEIDLSRPENAIEAAIAAYKLAWCDGPPFAYHRGLRAAEKHLHKLRAPLPQLSSFDPILFEPMPTVDIR